MLRDSVLLVFSGHAQWSLTTRIESRSEEPRPGLELRDSISPGAGRLTKLAKRTRCSMVLSEFATVKLAHNLHAMSES